MSTAIVASPSLAVNGEIALRARAHVQQFVQTHPYTYGQALVFAYQNPPLVETDWTAAVMDALEDLDYEPVACGSSR